MTGVYSRRGALTTGLGLAAGGILAACSTPSRSQAIPAISGEIVVGANLELTGVGSTLGKLQEQALQVSAQILNTNGIPFGGRRLKVRLEIADNGGHAESAALLSQELIDQAKVSAIIGGTTVETAMAMVTVAEQRKVPLLTLNSGDEMTIPLPQRKFIYKLGPNSTDVATVLSRELYRRDLTTAVLWPVPTGTASPACGRCRVRSPRPAARSATPCGFRAVDARTPTRPNRSPT
jgi:branched-chain amino acid transport system substrate-binding protein